ncbi:uncharacterized protein UHOD_12115 [Ustilago sp. UG-2017b]|nr:uncharacterized protein UHOD_12115 [Ustilago sp. UG-2017b]
MPFSQRFRSDKPNVSAPRLTPIPENSRPITAKWVFKTKRDADGNIVKYKAQLVARGFMQLHGIDYHDTHSPVTVATISLPSQEGALWTQTVRTRVARGSAQTSEMSSAHKMRNWPKPRGAERSEASIGCQRSDCASHMYKLRDQPQPGVLINLTGIDQNKPIQYVLPKRAEQSPHQYRTGRLFTREQQEDWKRRVPTLEDKGVIQEAITCEEGDRAECHVVGYHTGGHAHNHMEPTTGATT